MLKLPFQGGSLFGKKWNTSTFLSLSALLKDIASIRFWIFRALRGSAVHRPLAVRNFPVDRFRISFFVAFPFNSKKHTGAAATVMQAAASRYRATLNEK